VAAAACVAACAWDARKAHTEYKADVALRKRKSAVDKQKTAQDAAAAHSVDAASVKVARAVAAKTAKRA
jgi:FtsZ-interacting cell division protein ZipA